MKKKLQDMFVYVILILVICIAGPQLYQRIKPEHKNHASIIHQDSKYDIPGKYEPVYHYKNCKAGVQYEVIGTVWLMEGSKKIIQKVTFRFVAEDTEGDVYVAINLSDNDSKKRVSTIFSRPKACK